MLRFVRPRCAGIKKWFEACFAAEYPQNGSPVSIGKGAQEKCCLLPWLRAELGLWAAWEWAWRQEIYPVKRKFVVADSTSTSDYRPTPA